jgi:LDH2 family malate/lactate/ureidoglycolate dehydrogenase
MDVVRIQPRDARRWTSGVFHTVGMREQDAHTVADTLVHADLRGVHSHGIMRVPIYVKRLKAGVIDATATPEIVADHRAVVLVDANNAMGQVAGVFAMDLAIQRAQEFGVAWVSVRGSNHYGAAAYYALRAAQRGLVGITATIGGTNIMAPWGGAERLLGNNPFSVAIPAGSAWPVVLDMATSVAARGKIVLAAKKGDKIPQEWALGPDGRPTTDPHEAYRGFVRPVGDYKGYGLALIIGLLSAVLPGAAFGRAVTDFYEDFSRPQNVGHLMQAIDISRITDSAEFYQRVRSAVEEMHGCIKAPGTDRIFVPGEPEFLTAERQEREGIPYPQAVVSELDALGTDLGVGRLSLLGLPNGNGSR